MSGARSLRPLVCLALSLIFIGSASPVWAWGDLGHRVICQIAFQELNDTARNEVIRLIALDATFDSFTDACTWPDHPRKRADEHFINLARTVQTITSPTCPVAQSASSRPFLSIWKCCVPRMMTKPSLRP